MDGIHIISSTTFFILSTILCVMKDIVKMRNLFAVLFQTNLTNAFALKKTEKGRGCIHPLSYKDINLCYLL